MTTEPTVRTIEHDDGTYSVVVEYPTHTVRWDDLSEVEAEIIADGVRAAWLDIIA